MSFQEDFQLSGQTVNHAAPDIHKQYFDSYESVSVHKCMLSDVPRMKFYHSILSNKEIMQGKIVVDVGAGSGVLSCWAAGLGDALHVFSIEASDFAFVEERILQENKVLREKQNVTVIHSTVEELVEEGVEAFYQNYLSPIIEHTKKTNRGLVTGIDIIVSEWMGFYLFHEDMLPSVLRTRDFLNEVNETYFKNGNSSDCNNSAAKPIELIPSHAELYMSPMNLAVAKKILFHDTWDNFFTISESPTKPNTAVLSTESNLLTFHTLAEMEYLEKFESTNPVIEVLPPEALLHKGKCVWSSSLGDLKEETLVVIEAPRVSFSFDSIPSSLLQLVGAMQMKENNQEQVVDENTTEVLLDGFVFWFNVSYTSAIDSKEGKKYVLDTSPFVAPTHWKQTISLLPAEIREEGVVTVSRQTDPLEVRVTLTRPPVGKAVHGDGDDDNDDDDEEFEAANSKNNNNSRFYSISVEFSPDD